MSRSQFTGRSRACFLWTTFFPSLLLENGDSDVLRIRRIVLSLPTTIFDVFSGDRVRVCDLYFRVKNAFVVVVIFVAHEFDLFDGCAVIGRQIAEVPVFVEVAVFKGLALEVTLLYSGCAIF